MEIVGEYMILILLTGHLAYNFCLKFKMRHIFIIHIFRKILDIVFKIQKL